MALFGRNKKEEKKSTAEVSSVPATTPKAVKVTSASSSSVADYAHVLKSPRITEKATMHQAISVYTFDVAERATKRDVIAAVRALYKVTPRKIAIVTIRPKLRRSMRTGQSGISKGGKKAYVYLKKGETITIG